MSTRPTRKIYQWLQIVQRFLLPPACLVCHQDSDNNTYVCSGCERECPTGIHRCYRCALALLETESTICGQCLANAPPWSRSVTAYSYDMPLSGLIHQFKDGGKHMTGRYLTGRLKAEINRSYIDTPLPALLLPVPLYPSRMRARGFNQSLEITRHLSKLTGIPFQKNVLACTRKTANQKLLSRKERRQNLKNAFAIATEKIRLLSDKRIAVIDDVMTTGSTVNEISRLLIRHGAREVHVWTLARTDRQ